MIKNYEEKYQRSIKSQLTIIHPEVYKQNDQSIHEHEIYSIYIAIYELNKVE